MNNQERSVSFDARLQARGVAARTQPLDALNEPLLSPPKACGLPAASEADPRAVELRQNASREQKLNGQEAALDEALHSRASPYNLRWTIRN